MVTKKDNASKYGLLISVAVPVIGIYSLFQERLYRNEANDEVKAVEITALKKEIIDANLRIDKGEARWERVLESLNRIERKLDKKQDRK